MGNTIEIGKRYIRRDGTVMNADVGIEEILGHPEYVLDRERGFVHKVGVELPSSVLSFDIENPSDLISEFVSSDEAKNEAIKSEVESEILKSLKSGPIQSTLDERQKAYGDFETEAVISDSLIRVCERTPIWGNLDPVFRRALHLIMTKISRGLNGDPMYADNWHDIAGYATLAEKFAKKGGRK